MAIVELQVAQSDDVPDDLMLETTNGFHVVIAVVYDYYCLEYVFVSINLWIGVVALKGELVPS